MQTTIRYTASKKGLTINFVWSKPTLNAGGVGEKRKKLFVSFSRGSILLEIFKNWHKLYLHYVVSAKDIRENIPFFPSPAHTACI